jgi:hypothetical protein
MAVALPERPHVYKTVFTLGGIVARETRMIKGVAVALNAEEAEHYDKTGELPDDVAALIRDNVKAPVASGLDIVSDPVDRMPLLKARREAETLPPLAVGAQAQAWADRPMRRPVTSGPSLESAALLANPALAGGRADPANQNTIDTLQHSIEFTVRVNTYGPPERDMEVVQRAMVLLYLGFGKDNLSVLYKAHQYTIGPEGIMHP